jgi:predicted metal-dependent hydrolase
MGSRQENLMRLAVELFGSHQMVRDQLNALPEEYQAWLQNEPMPSHAHQRLINAIVDRQADRVEELRRALDGLKRDRD